MALTCLSAVFHSVVVRPEVCEDGVERVVCRSICTKVHSASMTQLSPDIRRFSKSKKMGAQICGSMVYQTIVGPARMPDQLPHKEVRHASSSLVEYLVQLTVGLLTKDNGMKS